MRTDRLSAALIAASTMLWCAPAGAQTRFAWPDTTVDVSRYTNVEDCSAAVARVREGITRRIRCRGAPMSRWTLSRLCSL